MKVSHTFKSPEREKLEIVSGLLQQAGHKVSKLSSQPELFRMKVGREGVETEAEERQRIQGLVDHFEIEYWSYTIH
ncbi:MULTISPECIES: hypothetical protein [unclassified Exiguobacterium]|uniref:hypothetical protein n=1 Tax=unclassified Exiguobacterium TaxID=2644629 RepID=UPI00103FD86D|nr:MULTISPECIES: hypothetical protein [unclassified Exiguobacterium]TCI47479.1 hypothetical protein EVJ31_00085 [Exiguobacterium sp. SH5S32]TCI54363.1 hypothetical protein EVJ25_00085 [Exiguobacterium sp. SH1S4]TCI74156.1 hypothetical protein EVJ23_00085 [Exiguobacterium sp. SH1S1]